MNFDERPTLVSVRDTAAASWHAVSARINAGLAATQAISCVLSMARGMWLLALALAASACGFGWVSLGNRRSAEQQRTLDRAFGRAGVPDSREVRLSLRNGVALALTGANGFLVHLLLVAASAVWVGAAVLIASMVSGAVGFVTLARVGNARFDAEEARDRGAS